MQQVAIVAIVTVMWSCFLAKVKTLAFGFLDYKNGLKWNYEVKCY